MREYTLTRKTRIFLYGAGSLGSVVGKYLLDEGFQVCGYIDQRAKEIRTLHGLICYSKEDVDTIVDRKNDVVLIVVKDVFEHERIKESWVQAGYYRIIYKPLSVINGKGTDEEIKISGVYDSVVGQRIKPPAAVPLAPNIQPDGSDCVLSEEDDSYIACIPSELIYTNRNRTGKYNWGDVNVHAMVPHLSLFRSFSGDLTSDGGLYLAFCEENAAKDHVEVTSAWRQNVLRNRYNVYMQMQQYLSIDSRFFIRNAPEIEWNETGYFNLKGGKHRASFLAAKKIPYIPCRVLKSDFKKWEEHMGDKLPESPAHVGIRDTEMELWKEIFCVLVFTICKTNLSDRMIPMYRGKTFLDLTENGGYLERNLNKFGLRMCSSDENADYVLADWRSESAQSKRAKEAQFRICYDDGSSDSRHPDQEIIWRGIYSGKSILLTVKRRTGK